MTEGIISIITNANYHSKRIAQKLYNSLSIRGFKPFYGFRNDASCLLYTSIFSSMHFNSSSSVMSYVICE